jgi:PadR family transcriptional regulator, regulatory protein AphA
MANAVAETKAPMRTTTSECLLGLLSLGPMSGYDIRQLIERSTANFWTESFGQIYPALKGMVDSGLATMEEQRPEGQRLRKVYRLTAEGRVRLKEWLSEPCGTQVCRSELLLKLFFGDRAPRGSMRAAVEERKRELEADLARYGEIRREIAADASRHPAGPYWMMTLEYGVAEATAILGWCERTLKELETLERRQRRNGTARRR